MQFAQYMSGKFVVLNLPTYLIYSLFFSQVYVWVLHSHFLHECMHVSLRSQECHGLQSHWFKAKLMSNLMVASMSVDINYLPLFCFSCCSFVFVILNSLA